MAPGQGFLLHASSLPCIPSTERKARSLNSLCSRNKTIEMPIILIQDFSGASLPRGLQADDDALQGNTRMAQLGSGQAPTGSKDCISWFQTHLPSALSKGCWAVARLQIKNHLSNLPAHHWGDDLLSKLVLLSSFCQEFLNHILINARIELC